MKITVKNYKSCRGNEGDAFSCTVYLDGKKAAHVQYDGWGGEYLWDFTVSDGQMYGGTMCAKFKAYCDGLPKQKTSIEDADDPTGFWHMQPDMNTLLDDALKLMLENRQLKRWCKKNLVYRVKGQKEGEWYQWPHPAVARYPEVEAYRKLLRERLEEILDKEGKELVEIANDRFVKEPKRARKSA